MRENYPQHEIENNDEQNVPRWKQIGAAAMAALSLGGIVGVSQNKEVIADHLRERSSEQILDDVDLDQVNLEPLGEGNTISEKVNEFWNGDIDNDGEINLYDSNDGIRPFDSSESRVVTGEIFGAEIDPKNIKPHQQIALYEDAPEELE